MRFGVGVPTGGEGLMYPSPFGELDEILTIGTEAERMGFDSVWANDHLTTQRYVRERFEQPPRYWDPLLYLTYLASRTSRLRLATCVMVMSFRHPAVLAKSAATLDHLSGGRLVLGVGIGAYREELTALWPDRTLNRGEHAEETLQALRSLFRDDQSTHMGRWVRFSEVESHPKPLQDPLPILSGGNSQGARRRAALYAHGWMPASQTPADIVNGMAAIRRHAEQAGRSLPPDFQVTPQTAVSIGGTEAAAWERFEQSQVFVHKKSLATSTLRNQQGDLGERNLVGTPEQIIDRVGSYADAGVTTLAGLLFMGDTPGELLEQMQWFAESVMTAFSSRDER